MMDDAMWLSSRLAARRAWRLRMAGRALSQRTVDQRSAGRPQLILIGQAAGWSAVQTVVAIEAAVSQFQEDKERN